MGKRRAKNTDKDLIKKTARLLKHERLDAQQRDLYSLHNRKIIKYKRLRIHVEKRNQQWSIDLADLNNVSGFNNQYRYLLVCVDVYSRYAFVKPLKTKSSKNVANKFEQILQEENEVPMKIHSDEGTEFTLIKRDIAKKYGFSLFHTYNRETKAVHAERFIQTIKAVIARSTTTQLLKQGDIVRIARIKNNIFEKSSLRRWITEKFRIRKVYITDPVTYSIEDLKGEDIKGIFYRKELQKI